jgi:hypothetical protein
MYDLPRLEHGHGHAWLMRWNHGAYQGLDVAAAHVLLNSCAASCQPSEGRGTDEHSRKGRRRHRPFGRFLFAGKGVYWGQKRDLRLPLLFFACSL